MVNNSDIWYTMKPNQSRCCEYFHTRVYWSIHAYLEKHPSSPGKSKLYMWKILYIKVTSGNLQNQDILVMDSSILIETVGGIRAMPHCVMGLFLQQASLLFQMRSPSSWKILTLLCSLSPAPPLVVLPPLSPGGEMAQCSVMTIPTVSLLKWLMVQHPPTPTHWQWLGDWWESISAVCPTSGHLQELPEA